MPNIAGFYSWVESNPLLFSLFMLWLLIWKGLSLWKSARKGSVLWFVVLMTVNTISLLEVLYVLVLHKVDTSKQEVWLKSKLNFLKRKK